MPFRYDPKDASSAIPAGKYQASIKSATELDSDGRPLRSKGGEAMQLVVFEVYSGEHARPLYQRFTEKSMLFLYRKLAHALGASDDFSAGKFDAADHIGVNLTLTLEVQDDPTYGESNRIVEFGSSVARADPAPTAKRAAPRRAAPVSSAPADNDVPFEP